jgi:hypothetical protein
MCLVQVIVARTWQVYFYATAAAERPQSALVLLTGNPVQKVRSPTEGGGQIDL